MREHLNTVMVWQGQGETESNLLHKGDHSITTSLLDLSDHMILGLLGF